MTTTPPDDPLIQESPQFRPRIAPPIGEFGPRLAVLPVEVRQRLVEESQSRVTGQRRLAVVARVEHEDRVGVAVGRRGGERAVVRRPQVVPVPHEDVPRHGNAWERSGKDLTAAGALPATGVLPTSAVPGARPPGDGP